MNEELKVIISAEIANLKSKVATAKKEIGTFKDKVSKYSKDIDKDFQAIGASISKGLKVAGTATVGAIGGLLALSGTTAEYRNQQAQLETAFENAGSTAFVASQTYRNLNRVLGDGGQATEAAQHLAKLTTEEKALNQWTTICQGVYATFGASLPIESLTEAANETAKTGTLTGALADALNWAGISEEGFQAKLDACNTEAQREAMIRSVLNRTYSEAAAQYEQNNAAVLAQNEAQASLVDVLAQIGAAMTPVLTAFTMFAAQGLDVIRPYIESLATNLLPVLKDAFNGIVYTLEAAIPWIEENSTLLAAIAVVIGTITTAIGLYNAVAAVKAAMDAAQVTTLAGLITAQLAHAAAALAAIAPYVLVVAAIAAVIAIIVLCVKHWDKIKEVVSKVAKAIWGYIKDMAQKAGEWITSMYQKATAIFSNLKTAATNKFTEIKTSITNTASKIYTSISNVFSNIYNTITSKFSLAKDKALSIFEGIKSGITDKIQSAKDTISGIIDNIKSFLGFDGFSWGLPKPSLPHFSVSGGEAPWGFMGKGSLPKVSISWYAKGGVFDEATLFPFGKGNIGGLGEAGAEAIVPLEKTPWIDVLAEKMAAKQGKTPIVLTVDGKVFAQTSIDAINQMTRQRGSLALNLV